MARLLARLARKWHDAHRLRIHCAPFRTSPAAIEFSDIVLVNMLQSRSLEDGGRAVVLLPVAEAHAHLLVQRFYAEDAATVDLDGAAPMERVCEQRVARLRGGGNTCDERFGWLILGEKFRIRDTHRMGPILSPFGRSLRPPCAAAWLRSPACRPSTLRGRGVRDGLHKPTSVRRKRGLARPLYAARRKGHGGLTSKACPEVECRRQ